MWFQQAWGPTAGNPGSWWGWTGGPAEVWALGRGPRPSYLSRRPLGPGRPSRPPGVCQTQAGSHTRPGPQNPGGGGAGWRSPPPCSGPRSLHGSAAGPLSWGPGQFRGGLAALIIQDPWGLPYSQVLGALGSLQRECLPSLHFGWSGRGQLGVGVGFQLEGQEEAPDPGLSLELDLVKSEASSQLTETRARRRCLPRGLGLCVAMETVPPHLLGCPLHTGPQRSSMRPRHSILRPGPAIGCHSNCRLQGWGVRWWQELQAGDGVGGVCWLCAVA